jgi:hypothetical protein
MIEGALSERGARSFVSLYSCLTRIEDREQPPRFFRLSFNVISIERGRTTMRSTRPAIRSWSLFSAEAATVVSAAFTTVRSPSLASMFRSSIPRLTAAATIFSISGPDTRETDPTSAFQFCRMACETE